MSRPSTRPDIMSIGVIKNKYRIIRRLGGGRFGEVYLGEGPNSEQVPLLSHIF